MAQVETIVKPDSIRNDIWRESVMFIGIHLPILSILESLLGSTDDVGRESVAFITIHEPILPISGS